MILTDKIEIKINSNNFKYYNFLNNLKIGETRILNIENVYTGSTFIVQVKCDVCNKEKDLSFNAYNKNIKNNNIYTCSNKCAMVKNKITKLERYGFENYNNSNQIKQTNLEKYGVENIFQSDITKEKIKQTNLEKYGIESHNSSDVIKNKKKKINIGKYGVDCLMNTNEQKEKSKEIKLKKYGNKNNYDKIKKTFTEKYNTEHPSQVKKFNKKKIQNYKKTIEKKFLERNKIYNIISANFNKDIFIFKCSYGHDFEINLSLFKNRVRCNTKLCTICNPIGKHISGQEISFLEFIKENYNKEILFNNKEIISPLELDIYLPQLKLAFEFNGLFWHNELHRNKKYHLEKTELCEKQGIQLIHIYEDDWLYKKDIVKSRILNLLGKSNKIYARKCQIKEVSSKESKLFLEHNHIQGNVNAKYNIGLYYNDELVSLMTFGLRKITGKSIYEMLRFCSKLNTNIVGGASKLFNYFVKTYNPIQITTYADRSWSNGNLYFNLNFKLSHKTIPNYFYIIDGVRKHRFGFRKDALVKQGFNANKTEHEIMLDRDIYRIYDSGHLKFIWKN